MNSNFSGKTIDPVNFLQKEKAYESIFVNESGKKIEPSSAMQP